MVDQLELHVGYLQAAAVSYCKKHQIQVQAWSPVGRRRIMEQEQIQKMAEKKQAVVMNKITFGAKNLPEEIEKLAGGVPEFIELVGLCTDICVISNAMLLKAFYPEVPISVDASACAGVTPQSHKNALEAMKMCQIDIVNE